MEDLVRFGISMSRELLANFDRIIANKGYTNRSEAIRDLVRDALIEEEWNDDGTPVTGAVTLVYNHHSEQLRRALMQYQHQHDDAVVSTLHVHLDKHHCLEVIVLRGQARLVKALANRLISLNGVKHGRVVMAAAGHHLP